MFRFLRNSPIGEGASFLASAETGSQNFKSTNKEIGLESLEDKKAELKERAMRHIMDAVARGQRYADLNRVGIEDELITALGKELKERGIKITFDSERIGLTFPIKIEFYKSYPDFNDNLESLKQYAAEEIKNSLARGDKEVTMDIVGFGTGIMIDELMKSLESQNLKSSTDGNKVYIQLPKNNR